MYAKVKLSIKSKNNDTLPPFCLGHINAVHENVNFTDLDPSEADYQLLYDPVVAKIADMAAAKVAFKVMGAELKVLVKALKAGTVKRGACVDGVADGRAEIILSAAFETQAAPVPTTHIAAPQNLAVEPGEMEGELLVNCDSNAKMEVIIVAIRQLPPNAAPGAWEAGEPSTVCSFLLTDLLSGMRHGVRLRFKGPNGVLSAWSNERTGMVP